MDGYLQLYSPEQCAVCKAAHSARQQHIATFGFKECF